MKLEAQIFCLNRYQELVVEKSTHTLETVEGKPVKLLATDYKCESGSYPLLGTVPTENGAEEVVVWNTRGMYRHNGKFRLDLVIVPKPPVSLGWVAVVEKLPHSSDMVRKRTRQELEMYIGELGLMLLSEPVEVFAK